MEATLFALAVACGVLLVKAAARAVLRPQARRGTAAKKDKPKEIKRNSQRPEGGQSCPPSGRFLT